MASRRGVSTVPFLGTLLGVILVLFGLFVLESRAIVPPIGTLGTITNANTASPCTCSGNSCTGTGCITIDQASSVYFEMVFTGACTCEIDQRLTGGTNFIQVSGSQQTANVILRIGDPAGTYEFKTTGCAAGSCQVNYQYLNKP